MGKFLSERGFTFEPTWIVHPKTVWRVPKSIQVTKEGYAPQVAQIQTGFRTSSLVLDIFPGALLAFIPLLIDSITGDWIYVAKTSYHVNLHPVRGESGTEGAEN